MRRGHTPVRHGVALVIIATLLASLQLLMAQAVLAHANLAKAEPAPNSVWDKPPGRVTIWFTEPVETRFSDIQVLDGQGQRVDNGDSLVYRNDPTALSVTLRPLAKGTYTVAWKNVSSVDGHGVRGSYLFSINEPIAGAPAAVTPEQPLVQSPAEPVLRWFLLLGILAVVGGLSFELTVWRPVLTGRGASQSFQRVSSLLAARTSIVTWIAMAVFLGASVGQLLLQAAALEGSSPVLTLLTRTAWGRYWLLRMALFLLVAGFLGLSALSHRESGPPRSSLKILALAAAAGLLLTLSLVSHSAAVSGLRFEGVFSDYLHLLAAGFWVGGLFHFAVGMPLLLRSLPGEGRSAARGRGERHGISVKMRDLPAGERGAALSAMVPRFSTLATLSVGTLIITGLYSAWAQVTVVRALATPYGLTLLAKVALLVPLLLLGAVNLFWVRPRLSREGRAGQWLRRAVTSEAVLAALVLLAVGLLISLEPARQVASRQGVGRSKSLTFTDRVEGADIEMIVEPGQLGPNLFIVSLTDRFGIPIANASDVAFQLTYLDQDIGEEVVPTIDHGGGVWIAHDGVLSVAGKWQAALTVRRPDAFDARAAFRFQVASGPTSLNIAPSASTGALLLGVELVLLGFLFVGAGIPLGGRRTSWGVAVTMPGVVAVVAGLFVVATIQLGGGQAPVSNPFPPSPQSLETGFQLYTRNCQVCHGAAGRGDGPLAVTLKPTRPSDLTVHVPLHGEAELYNFISKGVPGTAMAAWENSLTSEQTWHVINYLKALARQGR